MKNKSSNEIAINNPSDDEQTKSDQVLQKMGGGYFPLVNEMLVNQVLMATWFGGRDEDSSYDLKIATELMLVALEPKDELEGMLIAQMAATHNAAMECNRRAMIPEQTFEGRQQNLSQANKFSRTFTMQMEALQRYRGKGEQKMTVEHVHIHAGGQAIVGNVAGGGGVQQKTEEQPHAIEYHQHTTNSPMPTMPCADAEREPVPVARDAKRKVSNARRHVHRRTKGK